MIRWNRLFLLFVFLFLSSFFISPVLAKDIDSDSDGLSDRLEEKLGTDPIMADTDGDKYPDGTEVFNGFNPLAGDRDEKVERRIEVDVSQQQLMYFFNGVKIWSEPVSTGVIGKDTPPGDYNIIRKIPSRLYSGPGYYLPNTKWNMEFKRTYYLHGAYWHNQFGIRPMSHGCVNISEAGAKKLYNFMRIGDAVKVYGATPRKALSPNQSDLTQSKNLSVPFTSQAPQGIWSEPWKNACEEASIVMVKNFYEGKTLNKTKAVSEINNIFTIKNKIYGKSLDEDVKKIVNLINNFFLFSARLVENPSVEQIKEQIDLGQPVIVPVSTKLLKNKYFLSANGYHVLVLSGYDDKLQEFISQEPGTKWGKNYRYSYKTILAALDDYSPKNKTSEVAKVAIFTASDWGESGSLDGDNDGLNKKEELENKTLFWMSDTDGDGYKDGEEVKNGYNPLGAGKLLSS